MIAVILGKSFQELVFKAVKSPCNYNIQIFTLADLVRFGLKWFVDLSSFHGKILAVYHSLRSGSAK